MDKPFLYYDDEDGEIIYGNQPGLIELIEAVDLAIKEGKGHIIIDEKELLKIEFKDSFDLVDPPRITLLQKLRNDSLAFLFGTWFLILPFVAVGYIAADLFFEKPQICSKVNPLLEPMPKVLNEAP